MFSLAYKDHAARALARLQFLVEVPRRDLQRALLVAMVIGFFGWVFNTRFGLFLDVAETRCMPERLYLGYPMARNIQRGDVVSFKADNRMMFDLMTGYRITKIVAAMPGDHVRSSEAGVFINGQKVAERHPQSLDRLTQLNKVPIDLDRVLMAGEIFVLGTLPRSFDSRYWGVIPEARVDKFVKALL
jgi:conjugal transfer pilin signal peptidase TrbI